MKKLIIIFLLSFLSVPISAQDKNKPPAEKFEDYKPCTDCFGDTWKTSTSNTNTGGINSLQQPKINLNLNSTVSSVKSGVSRNVKMIFGIVGSVISAAILTKVMQKTNAITVQ